MWRLLYLLLLGITACNALIIDSNAGAKLAQLQCAICHNATKNLAAVAWPKLAGQHQAYLLKQMQDYRLGLTGPRANPIMWQIVQQLNSADLINVTAYYAGQQREYDVSSPELIKQGERLYRGGDLSRGITACSACHAPDGTGNASANFPALGGQHKQYLETQLQAFRLAKRRNDPHAIMRSIAARMSDTDIEAVTNYIAGLHP